MVEADDKAGDSEWPHSSRLSVALWEVIGESTGRKGHGSGRRTDLLNRGDVSGNVLDRDGILNSQAVRLALHASAVDEDTSIGSQSCE